MRELTVQGLRAIVEQCVGGDNTTAIDETTLDTEWTDLGLDSLALYEIVTRVQDDLAVAISDDEVDTFATPRLLLDSVNGTLRAAAGV